MLPFTHIIKGIEEKKYFERLQKTSCINSVWKNMYPYVSKNILCFYLYNYYYMPYTIKNRSWNRYSNIICRSAFPLCTPPIQARFWPYLSNLIAYLFQPFGLMYWVRIYNQKKQSHDSILKICLITNFWPNNHFAELKFL